MILPLGIGLGIASIKFREVPLTREILLHQYQLSAVPTQGDTILKWPTPTTVCIESSAEADLHREILRAFAEIPNATRAPITFGSANCGVEVTFLNVPRLTADGQPDPVGRTYQNRDDALEHVVIEISPESLWDATRVRMFLQRNARQALVRNLADMTVLWAQGFRSPPDFKSLFVDAAGNRVAIAEALSALHSDRRIHPGMTAETALPIADKVAKEFVETHR